MRWADEFGAWGTRVGGGDVGEDLLRVPVEEGA